MNSVEFLKSLTFTRPLTDREMAVFKHARSGAPLTCVEEGILLQATSTFNYNDICEDICVK